MYKLLLSFALLPMIGYAQQKSKTVKPAAKKVEVKAPQNAQKSSAVLNGKYSISGKIDGAADGMQVTLLNAQTGAMENSALVKNGSFSLSGNLLSPEIKVLQIANFSTVPVFLDNSPVMYTASVLNPVTGRFTGSPSHDDYNELNQQLFPYMALLSGQDSEGSTAKLDAMEAMFTNFVQSHPGSYVAPLAILRHYQFFSDVPKLQQFSALLTEDVRKSTYGKMIAATLKETEKIPVGKTITEFSQNDQNGKSISISSFRGKYVLIDFWASWCGPCRRENPNVVKAFNTYKNKDFTVLGVSLDENREKWLGAIAADNLTWSQVSDLKGWGNQVAAMFGIQSIPQNILIDKQGKIVGINLRGAMLDYKLSKLL